MADTGLAKYQDQLISSAAAWGRISLIVILATVLNGIALAVVAGDALLAAAFVVGSLVIAWMLSIAIKSIGNALLALVSIDRSLKEIATKRS